MKRTEQPDYDSLDDITKVLRVTGIVALAGFALYGAVQISVWIGDFVYAIIQ